MGRDAWGENRRSLAAGLKNVVTLMRANGKWRFRCGSVAAMRVSHYTYHGNGRERQRCTFRDARQSFGGAEAINDTRGHGMR